MEPGRVDVAGSNLLCAAITWFPENHFQKKFISPFLPLEKGKTVVNIRHFLPSKRLTHAYYCKDCNKIFCSFDVEDL